MFAPTRSYRVARAGALPVAAIQVEAKATAKEAFLLKRLGRTTKLWGHAAKKLVECVAALVGKPFRRLCVSAGIPVLVATSIKNGLDCEWSDPAKKADALQRLLLVVRGNASQQNTEKRKRPHTAIDS